MKNMAKLLTVIMFLCLTMVVQAWAEGWYYSENYSYSAIGSSDGIAAMDNYGYNEGWAVNNSGDSYIFSENSMSSDVWGVNGYAVSASSNYNEQEAYVDSEVAYTYEYGYSINEISTEGAALAESYSGTASFAQANYCTNSVSSYTSFSSGSYAVSGPQSAAWAYNDSASMSEAEAGSSYAYGGIAISASSGSSVVGNGISASGVMADGGVWYQSE